MSAVPSFIQSSRQSLSVQTVDTDAFDRSLAVNVRGVMLCYKYAARQMIKQGGGGRILGMLFLHREWHTWVTVVISRRRVDPRQTRYILSSSSEIGVPNSPITTGGPVAASYVASKFAVRGLTQCLGRFENRATKHSAPSYDLL